MAEAHNINLLNRPKYAIVCPVDSIWGKVGDQQDEERRDVLARAKELEETLKQARYKIVHHPDRKEGEPPMYWDEENLAKIAQMLREKNGYGATVYMYADGYQRKIAMRDGDSDNYKALDLSEWIKQFGEYDFITMHDEVGCPVEISLDINQILEENITGDFDDQSETGVMCKGPFRDQPKGTFLLVSEGGNRKKPESFHSIAIQAYSSDIFNTKDMAHWAALRKRKAGGRFFDNIQSKHAYKGGIFHVPEDLAALSELQKQDTMKYRRNIALYINKKVDDQVLKSPEHWYAVGGFKEGTPWRVYMAVEDDGSKMYAGGYYTNETGYTGFVVDAKFHKNYEKVLEDLVNNNVPVDNVPAGWQMMYDSA